MSTTETEYARVEQLLASAASHTTAAEADGRLLSLAAMLGDEAASVWLNQVTAETGDSAAVTPLGERYCRVGRRFSGRFGRGRGDAWHPGAQAARRGAPC